MEKPIFFNKSNGYLSEENYRSIPRYRWFLCALTSLLPVPAFYQVVKAAHGAATSSL
jgi:hypothetical protein